VDDEEHTFPGLYNCRLEETAAAAGVVTGT